MSKKMVTLKNTGRKKVDMDLTQFHGGARKGMMLQITQGMGGIKIIERIGGLGLRIDLDEPSFVQLTKEDARQLTKELIKWTSTT